jgi:uncharacterized protein YndB with AHSA1/START domain
VNSSDAKYALQVTTPSDCEVVMTRDFDAPRALLFDAYTKPELLSRWLLGPEGWTMPVCEVDLRAGGAFQYRWRNEADGNEFGLHGTFRAIEPPDRIVHLENFDEAWYPGDATVTTTFEERDGRTTVTMTVLYESREARDTAMASGMEKGVAISFDRLEGLLGGSAASKP